MVRDFLFLNDAALLAADLDANEELSELIDRHSAWLTIDIFKWPQGIDPGETREKPTFASTRLAEYARHLAGKKAVVAIHSDIQIATPCDDAFFVKLSSDTPISAFRATEE